MPIIKCKMCGGDIQLAEDKTYGMCEYCGSTMTLPRVSDDQRAAAFNRGNHFRRMGEFDKALGVYERIVAEDDTDAEAHWCCALSRFGIEYVEDPATYEWLPTCHRASFDSFLEDVDYLAAVEHSDGITRRQYQKDAAKIAEVQRGILATSQNTEPYDVFISYKELDENGERTRDSILAQEIYYRLTEKGWRVFFSRITLEDVPGTQYEPYIFAALNSAKVMIVVGTSAENLNAVWVKNEWSRFLSMMRKDRSKLLIPCYRDMDPYDLPEQLAVLMSYDMGKIGFIQDLIRGVDKVLSAEKKEHEAVKETVKETVVVQQGEGAMKTAAAVKRGQLALEESNWEQAKTYFEQALTFDAECAEAYFGMALAEGHYHSAEEYAQRATTQTPGQNSLYIAQNNEHIRDIITQYSIPRFLDERTIESYYKNFAPGFSSTAEGQRKLLEKEKTSFENNRNFSLAYRFAKGQYQQTIEDFKRSLYAALEANVLEAEQAEREAADQKEAEYKAFLEKTDKQIKELHQQKKTERESMYQKACKDYDAAVYSSQYRSARNVFQSLADFKDSKEYIQKCDERIDELDKKARIEQEEKRKENLYNSLHKIFDTNTSSMVQQTGKDNDEEDLNSILHKALGTDEQIIQLNVWETAKQGFESLGDYRDAPACAQQCAEVIEQIKLAKEAEEKAATEETERQRILAEKAAAEKKAKQKKTGIIACIVAAAAIVAILIVINVVIPVCRYKAAEALLAEGDRIHAALVYGSLSGYRDSQERSFALWNEVAQRDPIAAGTGHTVGLKADGSVVAVGYNGAGQCNVSGWTDIVAIAAGSSHTVGLKADGNVVAVGNNIDGRCDVSDWKDIVAIATGWEHTVGLKADGSVVAVGNKEYGRCDVSGWTDIVAIAAGSSHTVGLKADGSVVAVGSNNNGQCDVSGWTDIVAIDAGGLHTVGLKADGNVVAVGNKEYGRCDVSGWTDIVAIAACNYHTVGLKTDGSVVAVGLNGHGQCDVSGWTDIVTIAAGAKHTVGLKADGSVVAVGNKEYGRCDVSDWTDIKLSSTKTAHRDRARTVPQ